MRAKIILPNFLAVLLVGLAGFFYLKNDLKQHEIQRIETDLRRQPAILDAVEGFRSTTLLENVRLSAQSTVMRKAFAPLGLEKNDDETDEHYEKLVRVAWFEACVSAIKSYELSWSGTGQKKPEFIFLTDRNGVVVARNITPNACPVGKKVADAIPVVKRALDGFASYEVWSTAGSPFDAKNPDPQYCQLINTGLLEMAAAPVWFDEELKGTLVVGLEISNGTAQKKADLLGYDFAVVKDFDVHSSSFKTDTARQSVESWIDKPEIKALIEKTVQTRAASDVFELEVEGKPYLAIATPQYKTEPKDATVNLVMASISQETAHLGGLYVLLIIMGIALIGVLAIGIILANHFLAPVVAIEEGLLKVINGAYSYRFDVKSAEVGGLSYRINQLIGVLTGEEEESEEEQ